MTKVKMTREEFESMSFEDLMWKLNTECDEVTTLVELKWFIKKQIDDTDFLFFAYHLIDAIINSSDYVDSGYASEWWLYDYSMGTLASPKSICCKEDIEHLIDFED